MNPFPSQKRPTQKHQCNSRTSQHTAFPDRGHARRLRATGQFWILDLRFWIASIENPKSQLARRFNRKSKIENLKSKIQTYRRRGNFLGFSGRFKKRRADRRKIGAEREGPKWRKNRKAERPFRERLAARLLQEL
jgi:hypothetical protein